MVASSRSASRPTNQVEIQSRTQKPAGRKTEMTREQKNAHNERCRESRKKLKIRREELEKVESEHLEMVPKYNQIRAEVDKMNLELQEKNSRIRCMEIEIQELRAALQRQAANEERMRQIPSGWTVNQGQNFSSFEESVAWFTSQSYGQVGEGSASEYTNLSFSAADEEDLSSLFGAPTDYGPAAGQMKKTFHPCLVPQLIMALLLDFGLPLLCLIMSLIMMVLIIIL